ncbi:lytic murein transglycosylase B [Ideonella livida]|uniref:lytic murein transglycosylase B n=1 Tax=Ideonella livida TaxID=2707176 RepID=UPI002873B4AA|nr:lytic murein transglycosylase B [Ideonella livida]
MAPPPADAFRGPRPQAVACLLTRLLLALALGLGTGATASATEAPATKKTAQSSKSAKGGAQGSTKKTAKAGAKAPGKSAAKRINAAPRALAGLPAPTVSALPYDLRPEAREWALLTSEKLNLPLPWVMEQLARARPTARVAQLVMPGPPGVAKNWAAYRQRFIEPRRLQAGLQFWAQHASWLTEAEARWGVPPEVVVAVIGVETFYGRHMGDFRVLDALATLAFDFPKGRSDRTPFYRSELEAFLVWCWREQREPVALRGSYAGAMGLPQFMPSNLRSLAVDLDGDGHVDLMQSPADAIGSVAHYLASFGWQRGVPTHFRVSPPEEPMRLAALLAPDIRPSFSAADMSAQGAGLEEAATTHAGPLALVQLLNGEERPSYVAGTQNFWAITRYNWSAYYAMAVIDLAGELRQLRLAGAAR